jgi:hypothetical protein
MGEALVEVLQRQESREAKRGEREVVGHCIQPHFIWTSFQFGGEHCVWVMVLCMAVGAEETALAGFQKDLSPLEVRQRSHVELKELLHGICMMKL